jgi:hypothetical protein
MDIMHDAFDDNGIFFIKDDDKKVAEMTYSLLDPDTMIINHTWVDDSLRGKNIGYLLVDKGAVFAREHHYKIIPLCPFANAVFKKKKEEYKDVLKP